MGEAVVLVEHEEPTRRFLSQQLADDGFEVFAPDRTVAIGSVRLAVGDYAILGRIDEKTANYAWFTPVSATEVAGRVSLTADTTVTLDAEDHTLTDSTLEILTELRRDHPALHCDAANKVFDAFAAGRPVAVKGLGGEVAQAITRYGLVELKLPAVWATIDHGNAAFAGRAAPCSPAAPRSF